ncbi:MAG: CsgG/HfaB family protein [Victivallales bacterium]
MKIRFLSCCATLFLASIMTQATLSAKTVVAISEMTASSEFCTEQQVISDVMQAELSMSENITLVDRKQLHDALKEVQLGEQGMVSPESAKQLGKIVGAKYFCCGKISKSGDKNMVIVKVIDLETTVTKLAYTQMQDKNDAVDAGKALAANLEKLIINFNSDKEKEANSIAEEKAKKEIPADFKRPVVTVIIPEMHVRQVNLIDPAGETEIVKKLIDNKFKVINSEYAIMMRNDPSNASGIFKDKKTATDYAAKKGAEILIYGQAISELGATVGEFKGCRARLEIKAIRTSDGEIILSDSAYAGDTDLSEAVAGKKAIQRAAQKLADTFLLQLAQKWNEKK